MEKFLEGYFYNPTRGNLKIEQVMEEMLNYMREKPEKFYDIIVGCDSSSGDDPHFPVAVVILRVGEGGRFFLKKIKYPKSLRKKFYNWHQRILEEVLLSCQLALFLRENFEGKISTFIKNYGGSAEASGGGGKNLSNPLNYQFCYIHADVGENGQTKDMIREVTGLIRGNGFEPKIKPAAFVASTVADRYA
ncbi:hypothetical protein KJA15_00665 [Patescibacteria group bacterium]|nr:hypothetical protein [Patescibacteria group bacterium]